MTTQEAIDWAGSVKKLAASLDVFPQAIILWGEHPPRGRQYELQVKSRGYLIVEVENDN
jgi:hypothetical protein